MKTNLKKITIIFFCLTSSFLYSLEPIVLNDSNGIYLIINKFEYLEDKERKLTINEITSDSYKNKFVLHTGNSSNMGYTKSYYWIRFKVKNDSESQLKWLVKLNYHWFSIAEFYYQTIDEKYKCKSVSYINENKKRDINNRKIFFSFVQDKGSEKTYYLKLSSYNSMDIDIKIYSYEALIKEDHKSQMLYGLLYGIIIIMILYNFFLFLVLRDKSYLYYSLFNVFFILQQMILNLQFFEYIPDYLMYFKNKSYIFTLGLMNTFAFLFTTSFLMIKKNNPVIHKIINIQIALNLTMVVIHIFHFFPIVLLLSNILVIFAVITALFSGSIILIKGNKAARFYLLAWGLFLVSNIISQILQAVYKYFPYYYDMLLISGVVNVTLLSIALADRYRIIRLEKEYAEKVNIEQTDFFVNLSHEIKTPLTLISNYLDKYLKNREISSEMEIIKKNIDKLLQDMINFFDVLKFQKGLHVYRHDKVINLSEFLKVKTELFKSTALKYNINISSNIESDLHIKIDPQALDRVINNLIENAIKYNKPGGKIDIVLKSNENKLELFVIDTGIGINEDQLEKIFMPYYQISHKKTNIQGIGMGLSIVKNILNEISAEIEVKSKPKEGSIFIITFNRYKLQKNDAVYNEMSFLYPMISFPLSDIKIEDKIIKPENYNILIVEDNKDLLNLLQERLNEKYNVYVSLNGKEVLEKIKNIPMPDIIISDIMMDNMDGYELFDIISQDEKYKEIPFVFITAKSAVSEKIKGLKKGAIDFIFKPFVIDELISKIESIIRYKELKKENYEKDKFATIGMLIGGISHEIYNPLSGINAPLENIKKVIKGTELEKNEKINKYFEYIDKSILRIEDIINNLKILYGNNELAKEKIYVLDVVDDILKTYDNISDKKIRFFKEISKNSFITGDKEALYRIIRNLVANSIDSIDKEGEIKIILTVKNDEKLLKIIDNGKGINTDLFDVIFNAFYTTKKIGKGTGLGLYIVKDLVLKSGWKLKVDSEEGKGSIFTIIIKE